MPAVIVGTIKDRNGNEHLVRWDDTTGQVWVSVTDNPEGAWVELGQATDAVFALDVAGAYLLSNPM